MQAAALTSDHFTHLQHTEEGPTPSISPSFIYQSHTKSPTQTPLFAPKTKLATLITFNFEAPLHPILYRIYLCFQLHNLSPLFLSFFLSLSLHTPMHVLLPPY
ncbi:hypothetical protein PIB30_057743 [Stylosanthes scabra]|uniref:Uncharacterized protein n=1 Tax=Stylosanthes scabra TaxID=79078 RepID=A0ABU6VJJ2_9FABA|nr:hypothetical protein [Stylosanthes scabra]